MSESGSGEPVDSSTATDKDSLVCPVCSKLYESSSGLIKHLNNENNCKGTHECDKCGRQLMSYNGLTTHHKVMHDESIGAKTVCDYCGNEFQRDAYEIKQWDTHFCDKDCKAKYQSETYTGDNHHQWKGGKVDVECTYCGTITKKRPSSMTDTDLNFCDKSCHGAWLSKNISGENNPLYKENKEDIKYGRNWRKQRLKATIRDQSRCQVCGKTPVDINRSLSVHHIIPRSTFKDEYPEPEWWQRANKIDNLISLCGSCHRRWEGIPLKPDR